MGRHGDTQHSTYTTHTAQHTHTHTQHTQHTRQPARGDRGIHSTAHTQHTQYSTHTHSTHTAQRTQPTNRTHSTHSPHTAHSGPDGRTRQPARGDTGCRMQAGQVIVPSAFRIMEQPAGSDALVAVLLTTEVTLKPRPEDEPMRWVIRWVSHTRGESCLTGRVLVQPLDRGHTITDDVPMSTLTQHTGTAQTQHSPSTVPAQSQSPPLVTPSQLTHR